MADKVKDDFARKSSARAWQAAVDAERQIERIVDRVQRIEDRVLSGRYLRRCAYCGEHTLDVVCRSHWDLLEADPLAPSKDMDRSKELAERLFDKSSEVVEFPGHSVKV